MAMRVKENIEIDFDGFEGEFFTENYFYEKTINLLKEDYLKTLKKLIKRYKLNLLTKENLDEATQNILDDYMFYKKRDVDELSKTESLIYSVISAYEGEGVNYVSEIFPNIFNLKQSQ